MIKSKLLDCYRNRSRRIVLEGGFETFNAKIRSVPNLARLRGVGNVVCIYAGLSDPGGSPSPQ